MVVIAGREQPADEWRTDLEWAGLTHSLLLGNLQQHEVETYLGSRGVPPGRSSNVRALTRGHPLALSLVVDVLRQGAADVDPLRESEVIRVLIDCFLRDVPSARHHHAIEVCAQARNTTEALLAAALEDDDVSELFDRLRHVSFIEEGPHGLFPHDLVRDAFIADLQWRDPPGRARLHALLRQAVLALKTNPRDEKLYCALWHTYIEPLASQEKAAERLDLPFSTYRYHLAKGDERVIDTLWRRQA